MNYTVRLIPETEGGYSVIVPGLPGCVSQGETREEALANIQEALQLYLEEARKGARIGETVTVTVQSQVA